MVDIRSWLTGDRERATMAVDAGHSATIAEATALLLASHRCGDPARRRQWPPPGFDSAATCSPPRSGKIARPPLVHRLRCCSPSCLLATTFDLYRPQSWRTRDYLLLRMVALCGGRWPSRWPFGVYMVPPWRFGRGLLALTLLLATPVPGGAPLPLARGRSDAAAAARRWSSATVRSSAPCEEELERRPNAPFRIASHLPISTERSSAPTCARQDLADVDLVVVASLADDATVDRLAALNFRGTTGDRRRRCLRRPHRPDPGAARWTRGGSSPPATSRRSPTSPFHHVQRILDVVIATASAGAGDPRCWSRPRSPCWSPTAAPVLYPPDPAGTLRLPVRPVKLRTMERGSDDERPDVRREERPPGPAGRPPPPALADRRAAPAPQRAQRRDEPGRAAARTSRGGVAARAGDSVLRLPILGAAGHHRLGSGPPALLHDTEDHLAKLEFDLYHLRHYGPAMYGIVLIRTLGALVFRPGR